MNSIIIVHQGDESLMSKDCVVLMEKLWGGREWANGGEDANAEKVFFYIEMVTLRDQAGCQ